MTRRYKTPPVVEALAEVFFEGGQWDATIPGRFYELVRNEFPTVKQRNDIAVEVRLEEGASSAQTKLSEARSQFERADGSRIIQVGRNLVVVNQLRPYPHFEEWKPEVLSAVARYRELAKPTVMTRIGVRYLNRIEIPEPNYPMERYFALFPHIPKALGSTHGDFSMRLELEPGNPGHRLLVTFGSGPAELGRASLMLDFYDLAGPVKPGAFDVLGDLLEKAHANIERAFESIITDETRALFGGRIE
jgi:uncharacterized protein (TIGR04255 family)